MNTLVHLFNAGHDYVRYLRPNTFMPGGYVPAVGRIKATHKLRCTCWNTKAKQEPRRLWRPLGYACSVLAVQLKPHRLAAKQRVSNLAGNVGSSGKPENQNNKTKNNMSAKSATKKAPKVKKTPVVKDTENGITRPKAGTTCAAVWDIADSLSASTKAPAVRADVMAAAQKKSINDKTIATQFGRWRKYNGLKGRVVKPKVAKATKVKPKKAPKEKAAAAAPAEAPATE